MPSGGGHIINALPWSNGQTEGQIDRLKTLKRQMYGRANIDLLGARMIQEPSLPHRV